MINNLAFLGAFTAGFIFYLALLVLIITGFWKVFVKAGQPGWAAIIPIYNVYILLKIACKPGWWLLLYIIPLVNIFVAIIVTSNIAKNFGKGIGFTLGLIFFPIIFYPILGFSDATYQKC